VAGLGRSIWGGHGISRLRVLGQLGLQKGLTMIEGEIKIWMDHDSVDDQSLGRSPVIFPGSRVVSHDVFEAWRSHDGSCDLVTCLLPGSRVLEIGLVFMTWL
jgi:hypothetical protein